MLILTQTQKKKFCQIFTNIAAGFIRTTVTVLQRAETTVLAGGLNFAVAPDKLPVNDIIVQTGKACGLIPEEERDNLWAEVCGALKLAHLPKSNISKEE